MADVLDRLNMRNYTSDAIHSPITITSGRLRSRHHRPHQIFPLEKCSQVCPSYPYLKIVSNEEAPKIPYPWSAFLSQPVFHPKIKLILNPAVFQQVYQVRLLESCFQRRIASNRYPKLSG